MEALLVNGLLAFVAGILLNFTPCVLPVIPLKIRAVLQEIQGTTRPRILAAGALLLGSLTFFVLLGGATAYLGWKWGEIFQSRIFVTLLAVFLLVSGIVMLVGWSLRLPQAVYKIPIHRYMGAFLTGVLAGILSTPCSGPFLGAVLAYAVTQSPAVTIVLFTAIGFGLAFPYSGILLFPQALKYLPRGGRIGTQVESLLAFILIAGAIFFGQSILPTSFSAPLWGIFLFGLVVWGISEFTRGEKKSERLVPVCLMLILVFGGLSLLKNSSGSHLDWKPYAQSNLDETLQSGSPVLLEFTADWCINCKVLEKTTYSSPEVIAAAEKMNLVALQVDMTKFRDTEKLLLDHYGGTALPYAVLLEPSGHATQTFSGMFSADSLAQGILGISTASAKTKNNFSVRPVDWKPQEGLSLIGTAAPEWKNIEWLQGGSLSLKDLRGKVVLLRFWLTSCPYCEASASSLNEFWEKYHDKGLVVVGLHHPKSEQARKPEIVRKAAETLGFQFPIGMDNSWKTIRSYGVGSEFKNFTSVSFVIDQGGIIRFVHDGGEFHRTTDPQHVDHQKAFFAIDNLIQRLLEKK